MAKNKRIKIEANDSRIYLQGVTKEGGTIWTFEKEKAWMMPPRWAQFLQDVVFRKYVNFPKQEMEIFIDGSL